MADRNSCRFYERKFPDIDEVVMVKVNSIDTMGVYVTLLEYNNAQGMILSTELSRRRIRSMNKLIRIGRHECVMVLRVDKEKGYIDLSKRRVSPEDIQECEDRYNKARAVHGLMRIAAGKLNMRTEELCEQFLWPLYKKYGHAYTALMACVKEPSKIMTEFPDLDEKVKNVLVDVIKTRLTPQAVRIRADVEVSCFEYEGVLAVREALLAGLEESTEEREIKIKLVSPPLYVILTSSMDKADGIATLERAIERIRNVITSKDGTINIKAAPRAVSARDDVAFERLLDELENGERDEDSDSGDE